MKTTFILLPTLFIVISCGTSYDSEMDPNLLQGSEMVEYDDVPGLVRIQVKGIGGNITGEGDYYKGMQHGTWTEYDVKTGLVTSISSYYMGKRQGVTFEFDKGYVISKSYYSSDLLHGQSLVYDKRGVTEEMNYHKGVLNGLVKKYYTTGNILEEAIYRNGVLDGLSKWYDQEGNLKFQYLYDNGTLVDDNPTTNSDSTVNN